MTPGYADLLRQAADRVAELRAEGIPMPRAGFIAAHEFELDPSDVLSECGRRSGATRRAARRGRWH